MEHKPLLFEQGHVLHTAPAAHVGNLLLSDPPRCAKSNPCADCAELARGRIGCHLLVLPAQQLGNVSFGCLPYLGRCIWWERQVVEVHQDDGARWKAGQDPRLLFVVNTGLPRLETLEDEPAKRLAHTDAPVAVAQSWAEGRRLVAGGPSAGPRLGAKRSGQGAEKMKAATRWKAVIRSRGTTGCSTSSVRPRANLAFLCKPRANLAFWCKTPGQSSILV